MRYGGLQSDLPLMALLSHWCKIQVTTYTFVISTRYTLQDTTQLTL